jgi:hypothetical protein
MPQYDLYPQGGGFKAPRSAGEIAEEALRVQKLNLVLQTLTMFAILGTFLFALHGFTNSKKKES